jgi:hypothetical protein
LLKIGINFISAFKASSTIKPRNTYSTGRLGAVDLLVLTSFSPRKLNSKGAILRLVYPTAIMALS